MRIPNHFFRCLVAPFLVGIMVQIGAAAARAHGDDLLLIEALTEELARAPDANLFIRRGELFRHHQQWEKAEADFLAAARLEPKLTNIDFFRARSWLEAAEPAKAQPLIERFIAAVPNEPEGWFLRGDVYANLGQHERGAEDYAEGIARATSPRPEHFLRRARFLAALPDSDPVRVIAALDEGIVRLGPVVSLVEFALTLELARKNYAGALERVSAMLMHAPRPEAWLVQQGDILVLSGRAAEAAASYRSALAAIAELPERYRASAPMEKLARYVRVSLERIASE